VTGRRLAALALLLGARTALAECDPEYVATGTVLGVAPDGAVLRRDEASSGMAEFEERALTVMEPDGVTVRVRYSFCTGSCEKNGVWDVSGGDADAARRVADKPSADALERRLRDALQVTPLVPSRQPLSIDRQLRVKSGRGVLYILPTVNVDEYHGVRHWGPTRLLEHPRSPMLFVSWSFHAVGAAYNNGCRETETDVVAVPRSRLDPRDTGAYVSDCRQKLECLATLIDRGLLRDDSAFEMLAGIEGAEGVAAGLALATGHRRLLDLAGREDAPRRAFALRALARLLAALDGADRRAQARRSKIGPEIAGACTSGLDSMDTGVVAAALECAQAVAPPPAATLVALAVRHRKPALRAALLEAIQLQEGVSPAELRPLAAVIDEPFGSDAAEAVPLVFAVCTLLRERLAGTPELAARALAAVHALARLPEDAITTSAMGACTRLWGAGR
jgi:hypothetical protein